MRTITITSNNRPEYLQDVIQSLSRNKHLDKYQALYCQLEPGDESAKCAEICNRIGFINKKVIINDRKLGVRSNPYALLKYVFETMKSEFNVYLEDDVLLSPDCFDLIEAYYQSFKHKYCLLSFYNYASDPNKPTQLVESTEMVSLGMAFTKQNWLNQISRYWFDDRIVKEMGICGVGWDWSIRAAILKYKWKVLMPSFSRSKHIGKYRGTHCQPEEQVQRFDNHPFSNAYHEGFML